MNSSEFRNIRKTIEETIGKKEKDRSVQRITMLKERGILNSLLNKTIKPDFKTLLLGFIEILEEPTLVDKPNYRKVLAYTENDYLKLFKTYGYELGSWLNKEQVLTPENNKSFFNFPLFFKESCRKCNIPKYASMDLEELDKLLSDYIDLKHTKSKEPRKDRKTIEDEVDVLLHTESPDKNVYNTRAESESYNKLSHLSYDARVISVSKKLGSGYGFDLLALVGDYEIAVTTKASNNMESFLLSKTEYDCMVKASKQRHTNYLVHKYLFNESSYDVKMFTSYFYDECSNTLIDCEDNSNICKIEEKKFYAKNGILKTRYVCTPVTFKFELSDREKRLTLKLTNKNNND
jgi:hypothetical protein